MGMNPEWVNVFEHDPVVAMGILRKEEKGVRVDYCDPHVPRFPRMRKYRFEMASVPLAAEALAEYDLVLVATNHDAFDYELIRRHARLIVDTRGVYREPAPHIVRA